jgi:hypothetical protein
MPPVVYATQEAGLAFFCGKSFLSEAVTALRAAPGASQSRIRPDCLASSFAAAISVRLIACY